MEQALKDYGKHLGLAFQLVDDALDYTGDAGAMGKNVGDDLAEGKPTLPLIHAMANSSEEQRQQIRNAIRKGGLDDLPRILEIVNDSGALEYTMARAREQATLAKACVKKLPGSAHTTALDLLADLAVERVS